MRIRALSRCSATIPRPFAIESTEIGEINTLLPGSQLPVSTTTYRITHRSSSNSMSSSRPINPSVASIPNPRSSPMLNSIVTSLLGSDRIGPPLVIGRRDPKRSCYRHGFQSPP